MEIDTKKEDRVELLIRLQSIPEVAREVNLKDISSLYKYFKRLEKKGVIEQKEGHWIRTDNDQNLVELHNFEVTFKSSQVNQKFLDWSHSRGELKYEENNKFKQNIIYFKEIPNFIIRTTPISIVFQQRKDFAIRLLRSPSSIDKFYSILSEDILSKIPIVEKKLNIKIGDKEKISFNINSNHIAFINEVLAKQKVEKKEKFEVWINGEMNWEVDISAGMTKPHLETPHKTNAPRNAKALEDFYKDLSTGTFNQKNIVTKDEFKEFTEKALKPLTEQIVLHLEVQRETLETQKSIQRYLERDWFEDI